MNKISTLCAIFLLVCLLPAQAQRKKWIDGYAILATKDTIRGQILYSWSNNPLNEIIFKQNNAEKNTCLLR